MIARITAIALLSTRAAVRSRVVLALAALLLLTLIGLPGWMRGDGTPQGVFVLLVDHTLTACFLLLAATTLWAGCAAMAAARSGGTAALTAVKPVHPFELWFGKWLGIVILGAFLLGAVGLGLWLQLLRHAPTLPTEWRQCHRVVACTLPDPAVEAEHLLQQLRQQGQMPENISEAEARTELVRDIRNRYEVLNPGETRTWRFHIPSHVSAVDTPSGPVLRAVFETQFGLREAATLSIHVAALPSVGAPFAASAEVLAGDPLAVPLPTRLIRPGAAAEVAFSLDPATQEPLLIHAGRNLALLLPGIVFEGNLLRAAAILMAVLAACAACGLALGCCFSFPVASFVATALTLVLLLGSCTGHDVMADDADTRLAERVGRRIISGSASVVHPLMAAAPISRLARGEEIALSRLVSPLLIGFVGVPGIMALFSALVLRRRENGA